MARVTTCVVALLALNAWAASQSEFDPTADYYVAPTVEAISPWVVPRSASASAELVAARGEREAFFVVLRAPKLSSGAVQATPLELRSGDAVIAPEQVQLYRALWVDAGGTRRPDALVPLDSTAEVIGVTRSEKDDDAIYVEVSVPREATPGDYSGTLQLRVGERSIQIPVRLSVLQAQLPARASLPTAFDFSARKAALGSGAKLDNAGFRSLVKDYAMAALSNRITLVGGSGYAPGFESSPGDGRLLLDFAEYDDEMSALMDGVGALDGAKATAITVRIPSGLRGVDRLKYVMAFQRHLEEKGWSDRLVAFADHPSLQGPFVPESLLARRADVCALPDCLNGREDTHRWWSLSSSGEPVSVGVGAAPRLLRAIGWFAYAGGAKGLRYGDAVGGFGDALWNGTTPGQALFYPVKERAGAKPQIVESLRLKLLRDGLEDYELLRIAAANGHTGLVDEWLTRIAAAPERVTRDPAAWNQARRALGEAAVQKPAKLSKVRAPSPRARVSEPTAELAPATPQQPSN